ncbi:MAG: Hsp20/alpha crystallin family protein [Chloroflexi bacterium]|nr:Hsp20/alpha crystallin family protein [Chloroflexota bacterium]MBI3732760.1 Hsp20/alpha crystallin family protein [Chloroflexota bacterium]
MHENRRHVLREFDQMLSEFDRFFEGVSGSGRLISTRQQYTWSPPTDVYETDEYAVVQIDIAGMQQEDFRVLFSDGTLTVSGTRRDPSDKLAYQRLEIAYGDFVTQVHVPWAVAEARIEAKYDRGFLFVILPKQRAEQTHIPVRIVDTE